MKNIVKARVCAIWSELHQERVLMNNPKESNTSKHEESPIALFIEGMITQEGTQRYVSNERKVKYARAEAERRRAAKAQGGRPKFTADFSDLIACAASAAFREATNMEINEPERNKISTSENEMREIERRLKESKLLTEKWKRTKY